MIVDPCQTRAADDVADADIVSGAEQGRWRIIAFTFPVLDFAVSATDANGSAAEYGFRAELSNYPAQAPHVRIWDHAANTPLPADKRPIMPLRYQNTFQQWGEDTVYRPWERKTGPHVNAAMFPQLAWHPRRRLSFIFEDLHALLNKHARSVRLRSSA